jgi:uncharacterized OB-fold protein
MPEIREPQPVSGKPRPSPGWDNADFWEATARGELRFQRCVDCGTWRHYPRPICPECFSKEFRWELSSGRGRVYTWTVAHGPTLAAFQDELPYNLIDVLMDEGVHFQSQLLDCPPEDIEADLPVEAVFVPGDDGITLVKFKRA